MAYIEPRKTKDGLMRYRVQVSLKGHPMQSATFERKTDAKKWAQQTESAIREGRHFKTVEAKRHTIKDMIDRYINTVLPTKGRIRLNQKSQLLWWKSRIGEYTLADTSAALIAEQRDELLNEAIKEGARRSPSTVNRYLAALSHCFSVAVNEWGWIDDSPMRKVRRPTEPRGRVRSLDDGERNRLLESCQESKCPHLYPVVVLALSTGARQSEILTLKWKQVDFVRGAITLYQTKNNEIRSLPLTGLAAKVLKESRKVHRIDTDLVFPGKSPKLPINIRWYWDEALKQAEITDFRFHDLRHAAASYLAMSGATTAEIAEVLGHKTLQMVKRYSHLTQQHTAKVVARMNKKIFGG